MEVGFATEVASDSADLDRRVNAATNQILKCAPGAVAETKRLMLRAASGMPLKHLLDHAADSFANAVRSDEGREGTAAFSAKRKPGWVTKMDS